MKLSKEKLSVGLLALAVTAATLSSAAFADATYEVPVKSKRLQRYARFGLPEFSLQRVEGKMVLSFSLPADLVGVKPVAVSMSEVELSRLDPVKLKGSGGEAECTDNAIELQCKVRYSNTAVHKYGFGTFKYLTHKYFGKKGYVSRLQVAQKFGSDPVGVIRVTK